MEGTVYNDVLGSTLRRYEDEKGKGGGRIFIVRGRERALSGEEVVGGDSDDDSFEIVDRRSSSIDATQKHRHRQE